MNTTLVAVSAIIGIGSMLASWGLTLVSTTASFEPEQTRRQYLVGLWSFIMAWVLAAIGSFSFVWLGTLI